jgi:hypothetical protein
MQVSEQRNIYTLGAGLVLTLVPETVSAQAGERPRTCKGVPTQAH